MNVLIRITVVILLVAICLACGKGTDPDDSQQNTLPLLSVNKDTIVIGSRDSISELRVTNIGFGTLRWGITITETWVNIDSDTGALTDNTALIKVRADRTNLQPGWSYCRLLVHSNGGADSCEVAVEYIAPETLALADNQVNLEVGMSHQLQASVLPSNASITPLIWTSTNEEVANISGAGLVDGVSIGAATVIVSAPAYRLADTCFVQVTPTAVTGVSLNNDTISLSQLSTVSLVVSVSPFSATDTTVTWSTSNSDVASVDEVGFVTGLNWGTSLITVTTVDGGFSDTCTIHVTKGGRLSVSTTLTSEGSPYLMESGIELEDGILLNVGPGAELIGNGHLIQVWGTFQAYGTSNNKASIRDLGLRANGDFFGYRSCLIHLRQAEITSVTISTKNLGDYDMLVDDCILTNVSSIPVEPERYAYFIRNLFVNCGPLVVSWSNGPEVIIENNVFLDPVGSCAISRTGNITPRVRYNSFLSTDHVAIEVEYGSLDAKNNFWNTMDTSVIRTMISGYVGFIPFLEEPHPDTPDPSQ